MIWDLLILTFMKKTLSVAVIWRVVTDGWSIARNGFLGECSYCFKQKEKLIIVTFNCQHAFVPVITLPGNAWAYFREIHVSECFSAGTRLHQVRILSLYAVLPNVLARFASTPAYAKHAPGFQSLNLQNCPHVISDSLN